MNFLKEIKYLGEAEDLTELPHDVYSELENHIHKGAKDMDKKVVNALELVKEAYKVENVDLPNPSMKKGWEQFSTLLEYATAKLLKFRGIDGDWRMSSHVFHESINSSDYKVVIENGDKQKTVTVKGGCVEDVANDIESDLKKDNKSNDVRIKYDGEKSATITLWRMKVRQPLKITIKKA